MLAWLSSLALSSWQTWACVILIGCISVYYCFALWRLWSCEQHKASTATSRFARLPLEAHLRAESAVLGGTRQPVDAFLVLDVEGTCVEGSTFDYPNEIIEWPVCLLRWKDKDGTGRARELEVVDEFRSFVRPTWRPQLSPFCTALTGITQEQVDTAPTFPQVVKTFKKFLEKNGLIEQETGRRLLRFAWCTDGPWDVCDFVIKQCFISKIPVPSWITDDVLDVRIIVKNWRATQVNKQAPKYAFPLPTRMSLSIPSQLQALGLSSFQGRQHSGIDDTRNITRILIELARRGMRLQPNTVVNLKRRWPWMGRYGTIRPEYCSVLVPTDPNVEHIAQTYQNTRLVTGVSG